jgi:hypothetical protein
MNGDKIRHGAARSATSDLFTRADFATLCNRTMRLCVMTNDLSVNGTDDHAPGQRRAQEVGIGLGFQPTEIRSAVLEVFCVS